MRADCRHQLARFPDGGAKLLDAVRNNASNDSTPARMDRGHSAAFSICNQDRHAVRAPDGADDPWFSANHGICLAQHELQSIGAPVDQKGVGAMNLGSKVDVLGLNAQCLGRAAQVFLHAAGLVAHRDREVQAGERPFGRTTSACEEGVPETRTREKLTFERVGDAYLWPGFLQMHGPLRSGLPGSAMSARFFGKCLAPMRPKDPFIGRAILSGQFEVLERIGTGGMGSVYKASQPAMKRMVAIKILHPKLAGRKDLTSRFRREARAMSQLTHPNTVKVFGYGELEEDGSLYIVMELLEGRNLNQTVRKEGPMAQQRAIAVLIRVCGALQEAHDLGIVHRDLKPENIFLSCQDGSTDVPKVLDFGLAKVTERHMQPGSIILTQEGMVFGTPEFMSPEQAQGKTLDARSDIYSLAVILYEVLTGKLPFSARTPMEYIQKHVTEPIILLNDRVPDRKFPKGLEEVLCKALAKKPEDRYQTAADFAEALGPFVGLPARDLVPPASRSFAPRPSENLTAGVVAAHSQRPGPWLMVLVAAACLALGIVLAVVVMRVLGR